MAYTYEVPLSYTVNVSLSATPAGLADFNTNSIAIFSNEPAGFSENYQAYISLNAVESDFGTNLLDISKPKKRKIIADENKKNGEIIPPQTPVP